MVKVHNVPYINCEDVRELIGAHWSDCEFAQMAENDSYRSIGCDSDTLEMLREELEDEKASWGDLTPEEFEDEEDYQCMHRRSPIVRLENQIKLVKALREMGYHNEMLIYVSW
ncbi:MAG: hypothetical protein UH211_03650 [Agathobacter sp.]|nr:hypothetical protein [Agathobacter sp.]